MQIVTVTLEELDLLFENKIKKLANSLYPSATIKSNSWLNVQQLSDYIPFKPAKQTIYGWVNKSQIPFYKKRKGLYFLQSEIDTWLLNGIVKSRKESDTEIKMQNDFYLTKAKKIK